ncbi:MAG: alpha/beta fold hydrolase [Gemmatimonadetes bacterium]|nr:alpha/beta fold hydrolase [Gemmatimonadota bacterium]
MVTAAAVAASAAAVGMSAVVWRARQRRRFEQAHAARRALDAQGNVIGAGQIAWPAPRPEAPAALLLHGFNDTPQSMAYLAARLHTAGYAVLVPQLPGHGVSLARMAREARVAAWQRTVREACAALQERHTRVFVCGQSMGGALAIVESVASRTGAPRDIAALALLAPYIGMTTALQWRTLAATLLQWLLPYHTSTGGERSIHDAVARAEALGPGVVTARMLRGLRHIARAAERVLPQLMVPTLYLQSREDNRIAVSVAERAFAAIGAPDKRQQWLAGCGHILSADFCRDTVADAVIAWFNAHGGGADSVVAPTSAAAAGAPPTRG